MTFHEYSILGGTNVSCNADSLHRKQEILPLPFQWLPQRWIPYGDCASLEADLPHPGVIQRYTWAFDSDRRMCLGSNFATQGTSWLRFFLTNMADGAQC